MVAYEAASGVYVAAALGFYEADDGKGSTGSTTEAIGYGIIPGMEF